MKTACFVLLALLCSFVFGQLIPDCPELSQANFDGGFEADNLDAWAVVDNPNPYFPIGTFATGDILAPPIPVMNVTATEGTFVAAISFDGDPGTASLGLSVNNTAANDVPYIMSFDWRVAYTFFGQPAQREFTVEIPEAGTGEIVVFSTTVLSAPSDDVSGTFSMTIDPQSADFGFIFRTHVQDSFQGPGAVTIDNIVFSCCDSIEAEIINGECVLPSASPSPSATVSLTASITPSETSAASASRTPSQSPIVSSSSSRTRTPFVAASASASPSRTPFVAASASSTRTPVVAASASPSRTRTPFVAASASPSRTRTPFVAASASSTRTPVLASASSTRTPVVPSASSTRTPVFDSPTTNDDDDDITYVTIVDDDDDDEGTFTVDFDSTTSSSSAPAILVSFAAVLFVMLAMF